MQTPVIAIDGPSGSGKSTVARLLADKLGFLYIDTGAMFRGIGVYFAMQGIDVQALAADKLAEDLTALKFEYAPSEKCLIRIEGRDLTQKIREHQASDLASKVSKIGAVRTYLLHMQRKIVQNRPCVMEGRDIGTVVFPNAFLKVFLSASAEIRAKRRFEELIAQGEQGVLFENILKDVKERDHRDQNREMAPLKAADDAISVDSSNKTIDQVVQEIEQLARERALKLGLKEELFQD